MKTSNIGLIGLAVMGENLALNMESKGFTVSVYNRTAPGEEGVVDRFMRGRGPTKLHERSWKRKEFYRNPYDTGICRVYRASSQDHADGKSGCPGG